ncbi:MAG: hypothetical protein CVT69_01565 [Actinobacteria bacterium HGW-Actinobacteria-9]|nr:MAG: hypothetical protein CVT69_01565 [Actinobacteria bacterium HGW-Actinobacteria-9]
MTRPTMSKMSQRFLLLPLEFGNSCSWRPSASMIIQMLSTRSARPNNAITPQHTMKPMPKAAPAASPDPS